ncbi:MAG: YidC/Oxa1 family membrane protein insertase [Candidatus Saccharimonadales bacterium]
MVASIFQVLIVKPIFNLLVLIYALLPGHNFGLALILFTVLVRLLMWPIIKKQLHQAKAMRELQPEIKRIKQAAKGNKQKESALLMELYKERNISPFGSIGTLVVQLIVLIGLYSGLRHVVTDPHAILADSYSFLHNLSWLKTLQGNIGRFDHTLFGLVDLNRAAIHKGSSIYWPAMVLVFGSAVSQFYQSKQLMPSTKDGRKLRTILKDATDGKQADQAEVNASIAGATRYFIPVMIFFFTVNLASALSLYWFVGGVTAFIQQARALKTDETEMEAIADKPDSPKIIEGEVIEKPITPKIKKSAKSKTKRRKK